MLAIANCCSFLPEGDGSLYIYVSTSNPGEPLTTFIRASRDPQMIAEGIGSKGYNKWLKIQPKVAI